MHESELAEVEYAVKDYFGLVENSWVRVDEGVKHGAEGDSADDGGDAGA